LIIDIRQSNIINFLQNINIDNKNTVIVYNFMNESMQTEMIIVTNTSKKMAEYRD